MLSTPRRQGGAALALYLLCSFGFLGAELLAHRGGWTYLGTNNDAQIFIWAFAWWPHAIAHGLNPIYPHVIWAPEGADLAWTGSAPGLAIAFIPLTLAAGPLASYNVAMMLMPALAGWTAFLLCRHLTRTFWPSLAGGILFGFSSYELGQTQAHLFLSADQGDVRRALDDGHAAATIFPSGVGTNETDELRIAFDGDAVLFSDEAERIYQANGLAAFARSERASAATPLPGGPFKEFLAALHRVQSDFPEASSPIRTALVTARSAPAHERVIRTLRAWNIRIDEALFLGGLDKGQFLRAFGADIYFDDQTRHVESAAQHVPAGHVPHGIANP